MAKSTVLVPGIVVKELLEKYNISVAKASEDIGLSPSAVRQLINNKLKISIVIAMKLGKYFGKKPEYWINLQTAYELSLLQKDTKVTSEVRKISEAKKQPAAAKKPGRGPGRKPAADKPGPKAGAKAGAKPRGRPGRKPAADKKVVEKKTRKPRTPRAKPASAPSEPPSYTF
ncbi:MAG: HigA family addiction module antidote protein [Spirochaetaceae bacterium]|jgi:addiction module HigA family antidote|nr:HigA family addiction module antidote protein [Spirochaetaceae bacterium]